MEPDWWCWLLPHLTTNQSEQCPQWSLPLWTKFTEPEIPIELLPLHTQVRACGLEDITSLWPLCLASDKILLCFTPNLSLRYDSVLGYRGGIQLYTHPWASTGSWETLTIHFSSQGLSRVAQWVTLHGTLKTHSNACIQEHFTVYLSELEQRLSVHPVVPRVIWSRNFHFTLGKRAQHTH